jgi:cobalt-zinc-cadmium efflux system membrane fusion protein
LLHSHGALAEKDLEIAQETFEKAEVDTRAASDRIRILGGDPAHPSSLIEVHAPVSGTIIEQNVTGAAGIKSPDNSPNLFTIADLSYVWILCDVYENDLSNVQTGQYADVRLNAYPGRAFRARISQIGPILDPNTRTAKVRLELQNPGFMRLGMFVTATFHGLQKQIRAVVPASAVLHLHDRDWVYVPAGGNTFRRVEVTAGNMLVPDMQEIVAGIGPGDQVVSNALVLQSTVEQ